MRATLRRSCNACAKAKHGCDLRTPRCSRCIKKNCVCTYANEPLNAQHVTQSRSSEMPEKDESPVSTNGEVSLVERQRNISPETTEVLAGQLNPANSSFDPFDSYPPTRLPRVHVQRLIHHFLSDIAYQYYPLDRSTKSNPFVVSWWPSALADAALFHVSLQTASWDEELRAQQGFPISELLMADSVSLVRQKIADSSLAFQDETMNAVITLAAIEHGKGNIETCRMHVDGIKRIVNVRGGLSVIRQTSPLTARMVPWVSMLVTKAPQFLTQDEAGSGSGISAIPQWHTAAAATDSQKQPFGESELDPIIGDILIRLQNIFHDASDLPLTNTEMHDLTCFIMHKLLLLPPLSTENRQRAAISECLRYALALYMLIVHGAAYYSHADLANTVLLKLKPHLDDLAQTDYGYSQLRTWVLSVAMAKTSGTDACILFMEDACGAARALGLQTWDDVLVQLRTVLWVSSEQKDLFSQPWLQVFSMTTT